MDSLPVNQQYQLPSPLSPLPSPSQSPPPPPSSLANKLTLPLLIVSIVILVPVLLFGILNYLNVLSLSKLYPETFGFLPHVGKQPVVLIPTPTPKIIPTFPCPVDQNPCPPAEFIPTSIDEPEFQGLGYSNIASGTAVLALFDGTYERLKKTLTRNDPIVDRTTVTILSQDGKLRAEYIFQGVPLKEAIGATDSTVSKGEPIGKLGGEGVGQRAFYEMYNLIFSLQDETLQYLKLEPSNDKKAIQVSQ